MNSGRSQRPGRSQILLVVPSFHRRPLRLPPFRISVRWKLDGLYLAGTSARRPKLTADSSADESNDLAEISQADQTLCILACTHVILLTAVLSRPMVGPNAASPYLDSKLPQQLSEPLPVSNLGRHHSSFTGSSRSSRQKRAYAPAADAKVLELAVRTAVGNCSQSLHSQCQHLNRG